MNWKNNVLINVPFIITIAYWFPFHLVNPPTSVKNGWLEWLIFNETFIFLYQFHQTCDVMISDTSLNLAHITKLAFKTDITSILTIKHCFINYEEKWIVNSFKNFMRKYSLEVNI